HSNNTYSGSSPSVDPYNPVPGYFHSDEPTIPRYRNTADQYALFIEDRLALTSAWSVLAGLRYDHTKLNRKDLVTDSDAFERAYADFGWRVGTVYDLTPNLTLYAQCSVAADPVGGMLLLSPANSQFDMSK